MAKRSRSRTRRAHRDNRLFTLEVIITSGPMTEEFIKENPVISRTIQIRGDQTLEELHYAIFDAFGRDDEHLYEFQVGGKGPMDPNAKSYVTPMEEDNIFGSQNQAGIVTQTALGTVGLNQGDCFGYWFDFGDDWWHQIRVEAVAEEAEKGKYPKVIKRVGKNPSQYPGWEDQEDY